MKPSFGGLSGQKFVPRTMTLKVVSMSVWFCSMRSLKESVKSLLRLMSATSVSKLAQCEKGERGLPVNMRWSLFVYSKPQASFNLEIMLASASSDADTPWMRRLDSFVE